MSEYLTVKGECEFTYVIERSKFICYVKGVEDEDDAKSFIVKIKKQNSLANHNCYGYIADEKGLNQKFSDDGEPQGTAGKPILETLINAGFKKTVAVVTRYFGGIKLGTGGLVRAYGGTVSECLKKAEVLCMKDAAFYDIFTDYDGYNAINKMRFESGFSVISTDFSEKIKLSVAFIKEYESAMLKKISELTLGRIAPQYVKSGYYPFDTGKVK